jgi:type IV pilus assembly protein PilC
MGLDLIRSSEVRRRVPRFGRGRITRRDLITFCFHLEQLSQAGVPLLESLGDLRDSLDHPRFREVIAGLIESIEGGATLSEAMERYPSVFDDVMVSLIRAGEATGELTAVLQSLTDTLKWQDEQASHTKKLLTYPLIVTLVVMAVIFFLMTYLVPQLTSFIASMGQTLPLHTRMLIAVSGFFADYWYAILLTPVAAVAVLAYLARVSPPVGFWVDNLKLRAWVIGPLWKKTLLARFTHYFALMYASGITVLECMRISEQIVGNAALREAIGRAGGQIADGASISGSFEAAGLFPPLVLRMVRVGENTGELDRALLNVSYFYTRDVQESVGRLQQMIEPTMTAVLGGILAWVMFSVLGPIYDLITTLQI